MKAVYLTSKVAGELDWRMLGARDDQDIDRTYVTRSLALLTLAEAHNLHRAFMGGDPDAGPIRFTIAKTPGSRDQNRLRLWVRRDGQWQPQVEPDILTMINNEMASLRALDARNRMLRAAFEACGEEEGQLVFACDPADLDVRMAQILDPGTLAVWQAGRLAERLDSQTAPSLGEAKTPRL